MRVLAAVPHYFDPQGGGRHASLRPDAAPRVRGLTACIEGLHAHLGRKQVAYDIANRTAHAANQIDAADLDVIVCTTKGRHLLGALTLPDGLYRHHATDAEPMLLGFECRDVLRAHLGDYDWYCFVEDDLVVGDPLLLRKIAWFSSLAGDDHLLLPNRFEISAHGVAHKAYIDGTLPPRVTAPWRDMTSLPPLEGKVLGRPVRFLPGLNPHAACWFLTAAQMQRWAAEPWFADRDTSFVGPLESGCTLGILREFKIYKPAPESASFLEIRHWGDDFLSLLRAPTA